jgi:hypothetical protein
MADAAFHRGAAVRDRWCALVDDRQVQRRPAWLDQWDGEAETLYQPWQNGTLNLRHWFAPHNEHRIFFTRLLALGLLRWNHQWDPRLQMVVNAGIFALVFCGLFLALGKTGPGFRVVCWTLLAILGSAPYGATNTLLGFQSQFYFLTGFSLLAIAGLVNGPAGSPFWIAGLVGGCAALVSMGSGLAAPLAVCGALLVGAGRSGAGWNEAIREKWVTILAACLLTGAGLWLRVTPPDHERLAAKSAGDFVAFLIACLSWPGSPMALLAVFVWLPFAGFLVSYVRRRTRDEAGERFVLGLGFWVLIQAAALAVARANSPEQLESRYTNILAFGVLANAICLVWLREALTRFRKVLAGSAILWLIVTGTGLLRASFDGSAFAWKQTMEYRRAATAGFVATQDRNILNAAPPHPDVPRIAGLLEDPAIQAILPAGVRKPLALTPRNGSPTPQFVSGLSMPNPNAISPEVWTMPGIFSRFAIVPPSTRLEYEIRKSNQPSYLLFYVLGSKGEFSITDANSAGRPLIRLPGDPGETAYHAVAYCPGAVCVLRGSSGPTGTIVMEPKDIGMLSIAALVAAVSGPVVFGGGVALALAGLTISWSQGRTVDKRRSGV